MCIHDQETLSIILTCNDVDSGDDYTFKHFSNSGMPVRI